MFFMLPITLLVMFCVRKYYFVDFNGMFTSFQSKAAKLGSLKMHVLCKVGKNIIFQNKTFLVIFYRQNKTFWYQFCNFKHFLKAENRQFDQFVTQQASGLFCHSTWVEWLLALWSGSVQNHENVIPAGGGALVFFRLDIIIVKWL